MARHLEQLLGEIAVRPGAHLGELALLTEPERRQVVEEWNRTEARVSAGQVYPRVV